jgi:hypothetical protein
MCIRRGDTALAQHRPRRLRVARLVGELLSPPPIIVALALGRRLGQQPDAGHCGRLSGIAAVFAFDSGLPLSTWVLDNTRRLRVAPVDRAAGWGLAPLSAPSKATGSRGIA